MKNTKSLALLCALLVLASCGGGGGGSGTFAVSGTVSGLQPTTTLVLQLNGANPVSITENGAFTFGSVLQDSEAYAVTVKTRPAGQDCLVTFGNGTIAGANVTNVKVTCAGNLVVITDNINAATVGTHPDWSPWKTGFVYVIAKWDFYVEVPLTIQPGAIVKFYPSLGPMLNLSGTGRIDAGGGTAAQPIIFTSLYDDAHGGDTDGDGGIATPAPGDWGQIYTNAMNGSVFNYCEFYYGGSGGYDSTLQIDFSTATVTNSVFAHNKGAAYGALGAWRATAGTVIQGNTFYDNQVPMYINDTFDVDDSNVFSKAGEAPNKRNGIFLDSPPENFTAGTHVAWRETEVAYVVQCASYISVNTGASLTLGDDVVLKFGPHCYLWLDTGASVLVNRDGPGVAFTSFHDDTLKGDTDGDGGAVLPAVDDWIGIYDNSGATASPGFFLWTNIFYDSYARNVHP